MMTSLDQLFDKYNISSSQRDRYHVVCKPQPKDFLTFVQSFTADGLLPSQFNVEHFKTGHRLVPYGHNTYGIYECTGYNLYSDTGSLNDYFDESREQYKTPLVIVKFNAQEYERAKNEYDKFWEWYKNRNRVRLQMEIEHSFDLKHAMHLVRLLRMGVEALEEGVIKVRRPDAEELLSIRNGAWTYEEVVEYAEEMDNKVRNVLYPTTQLRKKPDVKLAAGLIMEIQDLTWTKN